MTEFSKLKKILTDNNSFVLTTHVNPDGDAIGSVMAMYYILKKLGKKVRVINYSPTPYFLSFLDPGKVIELFEPGAHSDVIINTDVFIALDFNTPSRLSRMGDEFNKRKGLNICIDHHQSPQPVFQYLFVDTELSATGHILYRFIEETAIVEMDYDVALNLYTAIMTDTGSFRFERTTPEVHRIAAKLIEMGVSPVRVFAEVYDQNTLGKLALLSEALGSIKLFGEKEEVGTMIVTSESLNRYRIDEADTEGFVNFIMSIATVKVGIKFIELNKGCKVSLRSKGQIPVNLLASRYGGGGHINAAGIRLRDNKYNEVYESIVNDALELIKTNGVK